MTVGEMDEYSKRAQRPGTSSAQAVTQFHQTADTDVAKTSAHHTIGVASNQAAAGNHVHNGSDSIPLLAGVTITGAKAGNAALASVIAALVVLGATDSSGP